ncbi:MAG: DUF2336 domain-containing protein [Rhodospirillales bacterium]|nr:DUF2336 domain-containing protein [Rhodospirillales bacterium]
MPAAVAPLTYEQAREMAASRDKSVREQLAKRADLPPEILYYLAEDDTASVRRAVAGNAAAPHQTHMKLAQDSDSNVRCDLAAKISRVLPDLAPDEQDKIRQSANDALRALARDQIVAVRQALAEALKDVAGAPPDVIKTLARDAESAVAMPVLQYSPVLSDEDLIEIIRSGPAAGGLNAIARRKTVGEKVSDAIAATNDSSAVADLLGNKGAQIREETLDRLIDQSADVALWQAPLATRPKLSPGAATKLAHMLADNVLQMFSRRTDLDPKTAAAVKDAVHQRLGGGATAKKPMMATDPMRDDPPFELINGMYAAGRLNAAAIDKALQSNDFPFALGALCMLAEVDLKTGRRILSEKNAKAMTSLVWKAGMPMKTAVLAQQRLAGVAPAEVIKPILGDAYPLGDDEMLWQIEFYAKLAAAQHD